MIPMYSGGSVEAAVGLLWAKCGMAWGVGRGCDWAPVREEEERRKEKKKTERYLYVGYSGTT